MALINYIYSNTNILVRANALGESSDPVQEKEKMGAEV